MKTPRTHHPITVDVIIDLLMTCTHRLALDSLLKVFLFSSVYGFWTKWQATKVFFFFKYIWCFFWHYRFNCLYWSSV